jgi:hypothetical protein
MPFLNAASSQRYVLQLQDLGFTQMKDLLPSLFDVAGPLPTHGSLAVTAEINTLQFSSLAAQHATIDDEVFSLSTSIRHVPISSDFQVAVLQKLLDCPSRIIYGLTDGAILSAPFLIGSVLFQKESHSPRLSLLMARLKTTWQLLQSSATLTLSLAHFQVCKLFRELNCLGS